MNRRRERSLRRSSRRRSDARDALKRFFVLVSLAAFACSTPREKAEPIFMKPAEPAAAAIDPRDQYALASALSQAQRSQSDVQEQRYDDLRREYRGKRLSWEVRLSPPLCRSAEKCVVLPFDHARSKERIVQGWLPRLELDAKSFAELEQACSPHAGCVFRFEGTLSKLVASPEMATSLSFSDVRIVRARAEAPAESWGRSVAALKVGKKKP
jgi:hypothetical protein